MAAIPEKVRENLLKCVDIFFSVQNACPPNEEHNELVSQFSYDFLRLARVACEGHITENDKYLKLYVGLLEESHESWKEIRPSSAQGDSGSINETQYLKHCKIRRITATRVKWYARIPGDEERKEFEGMNFNKAQLKLLIASLQSQLSKLPQAGETDWKIKHNMMKEDIKGADYEELVYFMQLSARDEKDEMREVIREEMEKRRKGKDGHLYDGILKADLKKGADLELGDEVGYGATAIGKSHQYLGQYNLKGEGKYRFGNKYEGKKSSDNGE